MIHIHVTQKLHKRFSIDELGQLKQDPAAPDAPEKVVDINPLRDWHANLVTIQRRSCVLLLHDQTRFTVFIPCLTKKEFGGFQNEFEYAFMNTILKCGANDRQMNVAHRLLEKIEIDTNCNRSVQGTLNQMVQYTKHMFLYDEADVTQVTGHRLGAHLADTPCTVKGRKDTVWPKREMLALLSRNI